MLADAMSKDDTKAKLYCGTHSCSQNSIEYWLTLPTVDLEKIEAE